MKKKGTKTSLPSAMKQGDSKQHAKMQAGPLVDFMHQGGQKRGSMAVKPLRNLMSQ